MISQTAANDYTREAEYAEQEQYELPPEHPPPGVPPDPVPPIADPVVLLGCRQTQYRL